MLYPMKYTIMKMPELMEWLKENQQEITEVEDATKAPHSHMNA